MGDRFIDGDAAPFIVDILFEVEGADFAASQSAGGGDDDGQLDPVSLDVFEELDELVIGGDAEFLFFFLREIDVEFQRRIDGLERGGKECVDVPDGFRGEAAGFLVYGALYIGFGEILDADIHEAGEVVSAVSLILADGFGLKDCIAIFYVFVDGFAHGEFGGIALFIAADFEFTGAHGGEGVCFGFCVTGEGFIDAFTVGVLTDIEEIAPFAVGLFFSVGHIHGSFRVQTVFQFNYNIILIIYNRYATKTS